MNIDEFQRLQNQAKAYREKHIRLSTAPGWGYFVEANGNLELTGWCAELPKANDYEPGVVFISIENLIALKTVCGNAAKGAVDYIPVKITH